MRKKDRDAEVSHNLNKLSFEELCNNIETRLEDTATSEQVRYLFGWFMGYRDAFNYNNFTSKTDISAKDRVLDKISNKYKEFKRKGL